MERQVATGRMRRVDGAVREVIGDAVAELKDPRVGFVTTHPDEGSLRVHPPRRTANSMTYPSRE